MNLTLQVDEKRTYIDGNKTAEVWLLADGVAVAWATVMIQPSFDNHVCLCDIETREGYRGQGYGRKLTDMISDHYNMPLAVTGSFTPEGFAAFHGKFPILNGYTAYDRPTFRSMTFVHDWENMFGCRA